MFWSRKRKQTTCDHDWHELNTDREFVVDYPVGEYRTFMYLYCPKCDLRTKVSFSEGRSILRACEIKKEYNKVRTAQL